MHYNVSQFRIIQKACKPAEMLSYWPQIDSSNRGTPETPGALKD